MGIFKKKITKFCCLSVLMCNSLLAFGDDAEDASNAYLSSERNKVKTDVAFLTTDLVGDTVDPYSGVLSFRNTDINIPGNSNLPVSLSRTLSNGGDWIIDIPRLEGRYHAVVNKGPDCNKDLPDTFNGGGGNQTWTPWKYHNGLNLHSGTGFSGLVLSPENLNDATLDIPDGYNRVIKGKWILKCTGSDNADYIAQSPDGLTYTFSVVAITSAPPAINDSFFLVTQKVAKLVKRIEDRFGNWVSFDYEKIDYESYIHTFDSHRLTAITANDGRRIDLDYHLTGNGEGELKSATAHGRTWQYEYNENRNLSTVERPDGKKWRYNLDDYIRESLLNPDLEIVHNVDVTHPLGTKVDYTLRTQWLYKPGAGSSVSVSSTVEGQRRSRVLAVTAKTVNVIGSEPISWNYEYSDYDKSVALWDYEKNSWLPIDTIDKQINTVIGPNNKVVSVFSRWKDWQEGALLKKSTYELSDDTLISEENYSYKSVVRYGDGAWGSMVGSNFELNATERVIETQTITQNGDVYSTENSDFNEYGTAQKSLSYRGNKTAAVKKYTKQGYLHHTESGNWLLNQPTTFAINDEATDSTYTTVSETTYYSKTHASYPFYPYQQKSFGVWQKQYSEYHTVDDAHEQKGNVKKIEFNQQLTGGDTEWNASNRFQKFNEYKRGKPQLITVPRRLKEDVMSLASTVNDNGWFTSTTDFDNNTTEYSYDSMGRIASVKSPAPQNDEPNWADTLFTWSFTGGASAKQPVRIIKRCTLNAAKTACSDTAKITTTTLYDTLLRPRLVTTAADGTTLYQNSTYNAYNQPVFQSFPSTYSTESKGSITEYDALQRVIKQTVSYGGFTETEYLAGNKIKTTDAGKNSNNAKHSTTTTYLAYGAPSYEQATKIESPESVTTDLYLNIFGNVKSIRQRSSKSYSVDQIEYRAYDSQQRLCQIKRTDVGATVIAHNISGEVTWQAQGQTAPSNTTCNASATAATKVNFSYDNLGSQRTISYDDGTPTRTFGVDKSGNVTSISGEGFSQTYEYNSQQLLTSEALTISGRAGNLTLTYGYDTLGNVASLKYPGDLPPISYNPNGFGQPTKTVRDYGSTSSTPADVFVKGDAANLPKYHINGAIESFTYGNGVVHKTTLNDRLMPFQVTDKLGNSDRVNLAYEYDNNSNITKMTNTRDAGIYSLTGLTYDGLDRLTSTTGGNGIGSTTLKYDGLGNIRKYKNTSVFNDHDLTYGYNSKNRLTSLSGNGSSGYNFNRGDSYDTKGSITHNGKRDFKYNLANQMISSGKSLFVYDGYNRRVKSQKDNGQIEYSMYSQSGKLLYRETGLGGINYIHFGSKLVAKEGTGVVSSGDSIMNYKPFGDSIEEAKDDVGYTGHKFDKDLGLSYMQARYYDPVIGRFYSNDPVGYTASNPVMSFNRYMYVNNNPYKYNDPNGEFLNFVVSFVVNVAVESAIQYATTGTVDIGSALGDAAVGMVNPAKALQRIKKVASLVKKSCCFVAGTQVLTDDGYKNIEDVKLGEKLWAKNVETGEQAWKPITKIFNEPDRGIYEIKLKGSDDFEQKIEATDDHPFYVVGKGWKTTIELEIGDEIETDSNSSMKVTSVINEQRQALTYNFTVADFHTYYVTKKKVLVHNCNLKMKPGGLGNSTKGSDDSVKNTVNQIANSGDAAAKACATCKLQESLKTRRADQKRQTNKTNKTYTDHKARIKVEQTALEKLERSK